MILKLSPITLRDTLLVNYKTAYSFHRILLKTDLPYNFDQINKFWWRWYSDIYGFYYNRVKRSYSIWLTMSLKQNIGVYMSFFLKMPGSRSKILDKWWRKAYLYQTSLISKKAIAWDYRYFTKTTFEFPRLLLYSEAARNLLLPKNRRHRSLGAFGWYDWELDMFVSSYNGNWNNLYRPEAQFYNEGRMPKNFLIVVNNFFMNSGFFINSFDSLLILYPQYFLEYHNRLYSKKIANLFAYFRMTFNITFYMNIIILLFKIIIFILNNKILSFFRLNILEDNYVFIYKINFYMYFIQYLKKFNFFLDSCYLNYFYFFRSKMVNNFPLTILSYIFLNKNVYNNSFLKYKNKILLNWKNLLKNKVLNIYFKYLNVINYKYQLVSKMHILNILKKFFNSKVYVLWDVFTKVKKEHLIPIRAFNEEKKYTKFLFNKISNYMILTKFGTSLGIYNLMKFLNQTNKYFLKKKYYVNLRFIRPSLTKINIPLTGIISWVTKWKKYFVKLPKYLNLKTSTGYFYQTNYSSFKIYLFRSHGQLLKKKLLIFTSDVFNLILLNFKRNFGFSYTFLVNLFQRKKGKLFDKYYAINLQATIYLFLKFLEKYFYKLSYIKNFTGITAIKNKIKINDTIFLSMINISNLNVINNSLYKEKHVKPKHTYKGLSTKKFTYWSFTLRF